MSPCAGYVRKFLGLISIITPLIFIWVSASSAESHDSQNKPVKTVVAVHCGYPPVSFLNKDASRPSGFFIDVMDTLASRSGLQVEYICRNGWPEIVDSIERGEADLGALMKSKEREKKLLFTTPIEISYLSFFVRNQSKIVDDKFPAGQRVGVIKGSMSYEQLKDRPDMKLELDDSYKEGIFSLLAGEIEIFAGEESMILKHARESNLEDRIRKVGKPFAERERCIAVRKDNMQLQALLNKDLPGFVGSPEYRTIYLRWYGKPTPYWTNNRIFSAGGISLFLIVCFMAIWRYRSISRINKELVLSIERRRKAEDALQKNEKFLNDILDNVGACIFIKDTHYRYTYVNRKVCQLFRHEADKIIGKGDDAFFSSDSVEEIMRSDRRVIEMGEMVTREETDLNPLNDLPRSYWTVKLPMRDNNGNIYGLCGISTDITEYKRVEEALHKSEQMVRDVLDSVDEGFIVVDPDYRILAANTAYCKQANSPCDEIIGRHCYAMSHKSSSPCYDNGEDCAVRKVFETGEPHMAYHKHDDAEGNVIYVEIKAFPLKNESGAVTSVIESINNITEKHLLEEERLKTQKLEAIGTLAGGIAHDFNNLLQGVFGYISLAKLQMNDREKSLASIAQAESALHLSVKLTNQLLTFSRGGKPIKKIIDLPLVIENAAKFALSGSRSYCRVVVDDGLWQTEADEGQIGQVIQNIVLNADQAMPEGGRVEITARNVCAPDNDLPKALQKGSYVEVAIADSGIGIPEQYLAKIFDPYFSTKERGSGLGLATSYSIIRNHNGVIDVKSEAGKGTTFLIYLPAEAAALKEEHAMPAAEAAAGRPGKILVMDDERTIRNVAGELIRALGHTAEFAAHGREAIDLYLSAQRSGEPFDIAILDLTVRGGMGGAETVQRLLEIDPGLKAVASSGYSDNATTANFGQQGFKAFLKKPYNVDELLRVLNSLLK